MEHNQEDQVAGKCTLDEETAESIIKFEEDEPFPLSLNDYQTFASGFAAYPDQNTSNGLVYTALKMNGEAGEIAELIGKAIRGDGPLDMGKLVKELGDVLWYVQQMAREINVTLEEVAQANLKKLADRQERGVIKGSGSDR